MQKASVDWVRGERLFNMWIIVSTLPGEFPTDPEDCNTDDQTKRRKEQVALFNMWIIVSALPGEFPTDPEDCNTDDQTKRRKEQVAKFHECLILIHF